MPNANEPAKKLKLRLPDSGKDPEKTEGGSAAGEAPAAADKLKWGSHFQRMGKKFPAKFVSKAMEGSVEAARELDPESLWSQGENTGKKNPVVQPAATFPHSGGRESANPPESPEAAHERPVAIRRGLPSSELVPAEDSRPRGRLHPVFIICELTAAVIVIILSCIIAWNLGIDEGKKISLLEATKENLSTPKEALAELDGALADLRSGNSERGLKKLKELEQSSNGVASLSYLLAIAAVQNGDVELAEAKARESIAKRERVSDALAVQSVLEIQKGANPAIRKFGDTGMRAELLLRQAILADAANPNPMIELATMLRSRKRNEEAMALLRGARSRLNPVDSHSVVDVTLSLSTLEMTPDAQLPEITDSDKDLVSGFSAAYTAMRKGDFDRAAGILGATHQRTSPDLFDYLINDPAFRPYAVEAKLQEFFH